MPRYAIHKLHHGEFIRLPLGDAYSATHEDYHSAFRALLELGEELCGPIVGCHSDHIRGEAEMFVIVDGQAEEYLVREVPL